MIIWRGHGILILVFGIIGSVAMSMAVAMLYMATQWSFLGRLIIPSNCWGAALAIWLYAKTMGKTVIKHYLDPATHQPVIVKNSHSFFFIPAKAWAIIATFIACMSTVLSFMMPAVNYMEGPPSTSSSAAQAAFKAANQLIEMDKGKGAFGNTPEAEEMAEMFSTLVKMGREMGVEKVKKKSSISLSHGKFLTYCRINPDSCAFMVHVPDLRKFSSEAKKYMVDLAWSMARQQAAELRPQPKRLAVGVRGAFMYDEVVEGTVSDAAALSANSKTAGDEARESDDEEMNLDEGIEKRHSSFSPEKYLEAYFEPHAADGSAPVIAGSGNAMSQEKATAESKVKEPSSLAQEFNQRVEKFSAQKAGQAEGNSPEAKEMAGVYAGAVRKGFPYPVAVKQGLEHFSAYLHVRHDTVAFMLGLPGEGQMPPGSFVLTKPVAWEMAEQAAGYITPKPPRIAVMLFMDGQLLTSSIGTLNQDAPEASWKITEEIDGSGPNDPLLPFFGPSSAKMVALDKPQKPSAVVAPVESALSMPAQPPAQGAAPASAPSPLPTEVRDWKDRTGRVMQASLESFTTPTKDAGRFKRADGQVFEVPFARLSAEDQELIRKIAEQQ